MADLSPNIDIGIGASRAKKGAAAIRKALDSIRRKSKRVHSSGARDAKKHGAALRRVAKFALAAGAAFAFRGVIKSQARFTQSISDLSAITGATGEDLAFLTAKSKEFGETTTLSASEAAEAFKVIASAKPDLLENVDALAAVTEEAIALAEATGESLPTAANTLGASLNQFGAASDQASRFINVLAAGSKRGAALVGEMSEALKFAGVIASQSGLSFEETNAALQLMSTFAIKGGEAGTQLRGTLLALQSQADDSLNPAIVGLQTALENLEKKGLDKSREGLKLFGRRNLAAARIMVQNRDQLAKLTDQLTDTTVAYEQQAIRVDNLSGDTKALKSAYEGLELTIGAKLNSTLRGLTQAATDNIRALAKNPLLAKGVSRVLDTISTAFQDIKNVLSSLTDTVTDSSGGIVVWEGIYEGAIDNIVKAVKFLWKNFVVGGPANLKLAFTLMIAAADRFRISLVEKISLAKLGVERLFVVMAGKVEGTFDAMGIAINSAIDFIINSVKNRLFELGRFVLDLGFEDAAVDIGILGIQVGRLADNEAGARIEAELNAVALKAQVELLDEKIASIKESAKQQREASNSARQSAIEERDATILAIEALRIKRKEIIDGAVADKLFSGETGGVRSIDDLVGVSIDGIEELGEKTQLVVDSMSDSIADFAAQGKLDFKDFVNSLIQDLIRLSIRAKASSFLGALFGNLFGALGGKSGSKITSIGGLGAGSGAIPIAGGGLDAAHGAEFEVGGSGGVDSQKVTFNATPGETVSIRTPSQQSKGGGDIFINFTQSIVADGADAQKFQAQVPLLMQQARKAAVADILLLKKQGVFLRA